MARADSYDERIHTHGTFSGYTIQNGDKISRYPGGNIRPAAESAEWRQVAHSGRLLA